MAAWSSSVTSLVAALQYLQIVRCQCHLMMMMTGSVKRRIKNLRQDLDFELAQADVKQFQQSGLP